MECKHDEYRDILLTLDACNILGTDKYVLRISVYVIPMLKC